MSKENFYTLLSRYRSGNCTDQEKRLVEQWFATQGEEIPVRSDQENNTIEERIWSAIQDQTEPEKPVIHLWRWVAAAVAFIALVWGGYKFSSSENGLADGMMAVHSARESLATESNTSDSMKIFRLPDGSEIQLSPNSSISYPLQFEGNTREVFLKGKAFFNVTRDTERPFFVHSGEVITKVLGTSFWVAGSDNNEAIEVSVVTGKVSVSQNTGGNKPETGIVKGGVILTANQRVKYTPLTHSFETGLVTNPIPLTSKKEMPEAESFAFEDVPITAVIGKLEKTYGIEIILENEALTGCLFKGDITHQPLFTKLDLLCSSINAGYEVRGTRILISGKGCSTDNLNP